MTVVAIFTVGSGYFSSLVRFVALRALGNFPVDVMTPGAVEGLVLALKLSEQPDLRFVASLTGIVARTLQRYSQRPVGIRMTFETVGHLQIEMIIP